MVTAPEAAVVAAGTVDALKLETAPCLGQMKEAAQDRFKATLDGGCDEDGPVVDYSHDVTINGPHGMPAGPTSASDSDGSTDIGHANGHEYTSNGAPAALPIPPPTGRKAIPCRFHYKKCCLHGEAGEGCPFSHTIPWQAQADPTYRAAHNRGVSLPSFAHIPITPTAYGGGVQSSPGQPPYYTPQQASLDWGYSPQGYGAPPATASGATQSSHTVPPSQSNPGTFHDYRYGPTGFPHPSYVPGYGYPYYLPPPAMYGGMQPSSGSVPLNQGEFAPPATAPGYPADYQNVVSPSCPPLQMITPNYSGSAANPSTEAEAGLAIPTSEGEVGVNAHQNMADVADGTNNGVAPPAEQVPSYYQSGPPLPPSPPAYGPPNQHRSRGPSYPKNRSMVSGRGRSTMGRSRFSTHDGVLASAESDDRPPRGPCSFFAQGACCFGDKCSFGHVMPNGDDAREYRLDYRGVDGPEGTMGVMRHGRLPKSDAFVPQSVPGYTIWRERQKQKEKHHRMITGHANLSQSVPQLPTASRNRSEFGENGLEARHKVDEAVQQRRDGNFASRRHHPHSHSHGHMTQFMKSPNATRPVIQLPEQRVPSHDDFPALVTSSSSPTQLGTPCRSDVTSSTLFPKVVEVVEKEFQVASPSTTCEAATLDSLANSVCSVSHDDPACGGGNTASLAEPSSANPVQQARLIGSFASAAARALSAPPSRMGSASNTVNPSPRAVVAEVT